MKSWKLVIIQPALPPYRIDFFDRLNSIMNGEFVVYASIGELDGFPELKGMEWLRELPKLIYSRVGLEWQRGAININICQGDVLVVCGAPRTVSTLLLLLRAKIMGVRTIWWGHFWSGTSKKWRFQIRLAILKISDAVLFYTDSELSEYQNKHNKYNLMLAGAINNGIAVEPIQLVRRTYAAKERSKSIVFIGRLTTKAGLDILIESLSFDEMRGVNLDVIGSGAQEGTMKSLAIELGVSDRVIWHGPLVCESSIAPIMNNCRLFCYPGQVGLSLIHAMAYGLPAVVHSDPKTQMPEYAAFAENRTGWSFCPGSSKKLAAKISLVINDFPALDSASKNATFVADNVHNTRVMADRLMEMVAILKME